ncbi:hypothetical protein ACFWHQ_30855 [Streptomyces sp. NPDC060334]|uniref:hypothetical protein n=1 Tax=unclassified Streptomyces TaxID=2593676 RepID=UPI003662A110
MPFVPSRARTRAALTAGALVVVVASAALAGCSPAAENGPRVPHGIGPARTTTETARLLHDAEQWLLRTCMRRAGFDYHPVPDDDPPSVERAFPYVLTEPAWAGAHGYGSDLERRRRELAVRDPNRGYFASLPAERKALALLAANGPGPDGVRATLPTGGVVRRSDRGCVSGAQRELYGDLRAWFQASTTVHALDAIRRGRVLADPRYADGVRAWARCMRESGYRYPDPARTRAAALSPATAMSPGRERALARAEVRCAERSGLSATAGRLDELHAAALRAEHHRAVAEKDRLEAAALPRARAVLGGRTEH